MSDMEFIPDEGLDECEDTEMFVRYIAFSREALKRDSLTKIDRAVIESCLAKLETLI
jgi:hypothetical protein